MIMFFIKSLKSPTDNFNIYDHISFARGPTTADLVYIGSYVIHPRSQTATQHYFFFNRIVRLYSSLPINIIEVK